MTARISSIAWMIFAILAPIYMLSMFQRMVPAVIAPEIAADLGVNVTDMVAMSSAAFMAYGIMQLPSGLLTDWLGSKKTVLLVSVLGVAGVIGFSLAPTLGFAVGSRVILGLGCAVIVPSLKILAEIFPKNAFAKIYGFFLAIGLFGTVLAGAPMGLVSELFGWRLVMLASALFCLGLLAILFFTPVTDSCTARNLAPQKNNTLQELTDGLKFVLKNRGFWPLCIWFSLLAGINFSFGGLWWGPYMMAECGLTKAQAGLVISLSYLVNLPATPLLAILSDYFHTRKIILIICGALLFSGMLLSALLGSSMTMPLFIIMGLLIGIAFSCASVCFASTRESFPLAITGTALGVLQTLPYLVLTPVLQKLFGFVLEVFGGNSPDQHAWSAAIWVYAASSGIIFILGFFLKETFPKSGS